MLPFARMVRYGNVVAAKNHIKMVATGTGFFFVLSSTGDLWASGDNTYHQFGTTHTTSYFGTYLKIDTNIDGIWASTNFSVMKKRNGTFWYCGLGGIHNTQTEWEQITAFGDLDPNDIVDVYCSFNMVHFKNSTGNLYAIGMNGNSNAGTGIGAGTQVTECTLVPNITNVKYMVYTSTAGTVFALTNDGKAYGWGRNANGELGQGNNTAISTPKLIESGVDSVFSGYSALGYTAGSWVRTAGNQIYGQLGNGNYSTQHVNQMTFNAVNFNVVPPGTIPIYRSGGEFNMGIVTSAGIYAAGYSTGLFGTGVASGTGNALFTKGVVPFLMSDIIGANTMSQTSCIYSTDKLYQSGNTKYIIGQNGAAGNILNFIEVPVPWQE